MLAFRRSECPYPVLQAGLRGLRADAQYKLEIFDESRARTEQTVSGRDLQSDFELRLPKKGTSLLLRYRPAVPSSPIRVRIRDKRKDERACPGRLCRPSMTRRIFMQDGTYTIRTMRREEVDLAIEWAAEEGWNPGLHDADCFYAADPNGFLIGLLDEEPIATISVVKYGRSFGFLGFYIVKPAYRGKGYGIRIWNAGLKYLEGRNVGLDGVLGQQDNYRKSGFRFAYRNVRYEGRGLGGASHSSGIVELSEIPFETVEAYDRPFFPAARTQFLKSWIRQPSGKALGILQGNALAGYGVIRPCRSGYKIGPLFANRPDLAESLFTALASEAEPAAPVYLDVPQVNLAAVELAERHKMKVVFETARMYTGKEPEIVLDRLFGVTTFELG